MYVSFAPTGNNLPDTTASALLSTGQGRIIITACRENQKSYIGGGECTIFTHALVNGLRGQGTVNHRGYISAFDLYTRLYYTVSETVSKRIKAEQQPELTVLKGVGPFAVSLFRGATTLGAFEDTELLPEEAQVREVSPKQSQRMFRQIINITGDGNAVGKNNVIQVVKAGDGSKISGVTQRVGEK